MDKPFVAAKETYAVPAFLLGVLPLRMSDVIGVSLAAVALVGGGYFMAHAQAASGLNTGEFFQGIAIAALGCGHGLAVAKLGRSSRR